MSKHISDHIDHFFRSRGMDWILTRQMSWVFHGLVGLLLGLLLGMYGAGLGTGGYGYKEYLESKYFTRITMDNWMDFICPFVGGLIGMFIHWLIFRNSIFIPW